MAAIRVNISQCRAERVSRSFESLLVYRTYLGFFECSLSAHVRQWSSSEKNHSWRQKNKVLRSRHQTQRGDRGQRRTAHHQKEGCSSQPVRELGLPLTSHAPGPSLSNHLSSLQCHTDGYGTTLQSNQTVVLFIAQNRNSESAENVLISDINRHDFEIKVI